MSQLKAQTCLSLDNELLNNFPPLTSLRAQVPGNLSVSFLMVVGGGSIYLIYLISCRGLWGGAADCTSGEHLMH